LIRVNAVPGAKGRVQSRGRRVLRTLNFALVGLSFATLSGCTDWAGYDLDSFWGKVPILSTMRHSVAYDPYEMPRLPAEHSVPVEDPNGAIPPHFAQAQLDSVAATLHSPYTTTDPAVVARGKVVFDTQCTPCHGPEGAGNGPVVGPGKFPFALPVNGAATAGRADGYIYGVITVGRGLMPPYGEKIADLDRWAVVAYVRQLERQGGATAATPAAPATTPAPAAPAR
jgi:mono/diheme cytochrome c family protein